MSIQMLLQQQTPAPSPPRSAERGEGGVSKLAVGGVRAAVGRGVYGGVTSGWILRSASRQQLHLNGRRRTFRPGKEP